MHVSRYASILARSSWFLVVNSRISGLVVMNPCVVICPATSGLTPALDTSSMTAAARFVGALDAPACGCGTQLLPDQRSARLVGECGVWAKKSQCETRERG